MLFVSTADHEFVVSIIGIKFHFVGRYDGPIQPASLLNRTYRGRQLYGPILCYGWKSNNIQPLNKALQAEMLDRLKDTEVRV